MRKLDGQTLLLGSVITGVIVAIVYVGFFHHGGFGEGQANGSVTQRPANIPVDGQRSYAYLKQICDIGQRISGTAGMQKQQELLKRHFEALGGKVSLQEFQVRHPEDGSPVPMANLLVQWFPEKQERILLCAHYDTRPFPDQDRRDPRGVFIGANDGGSGVAVLCELANHMPGLQCRYGVDFVLFDGEEFVFDDRRDKNYYFLGSTHFARAYRNDPPPYRYKFGVLLDMVGDANLRIYRDAYSFSTRRPATRALVYDIWNTARRLGVKEFVHRTRRQEIRDDHLPLNEIARIPTCDIIDFDYPTVGARSYWHTTQDTLDKCSAESLQTVGWVVLEWLQAAQ